jgi:predicted thioesterase
MVLLNFGRFGMEINSIYKKSTVVQEKNSAAALKSGSLPVFATPSMIALMEQTAAEHVQPYIENGFTTVGISVNIKHIAATPIGMTVNCECTLVAIDGKKLTFSLKAYDECELIGEGTHERFIVNCEKFMSRVNSKKA